MTDSGHVLIKQSNRATIVVRGVTLEGLTVSEVHTTIGEPAKWNVYVHDVLTAQGVDFFELTKWSAIIYDLIMGAK